MLSWVCWRSMAAGFLFTLACFASCAQAQSLVTSNDYAAVVHEAVAEFEDQHFDEARALFQRAHELQPSARTVRGLGLASFGLRDYEGAVRNLEQALASTVRPLKGELRAEADTLLKRAYGFVGRFQIGLAPATAQLLVDDVETGLRAGDRLLLSPGRHRVEAHAPAYEADKRSVDVIGGEDTGLSFTLVPLPQPVLVATPVAAAQTVVPRAVVVEPMPPLQQERPAQAPLYKNPWLWGGVGAAVVVLAVVIGVSAGGGGTSYAKLDSQNMPRGGVLTLP